MRGKCIYRVIKPPIIIKQEERSESKKTSRLLKKLYFIRHLYRECVK